MDPLLAGTEKGWRAPANCICLLKGKAHFQMLSRFAFICASLIRVENHVEINSLFAWCVGREVGSLLFPLKQIWAYGLGVAILESSHEVASMSGWVDPMVFVVCRISVSKQGCWSCVMRLERLWACAGGSGTLHHLGISWGDANFLTLPLSSFPHSSLKLSAAASLSLCLFL